MTTYEGISRETCNKVSVGHTAKYTDPRENVRATSKLQGTQSHQKCVNSTCSHTSSWDFFVPKRLGVWALKAGSYGTHKRLEQDRKLQACGGVGVHAHVPVFCCLFSLCPKGPIAVITWAVTTFCCLHTQTIPFSKLNESSEMFLKAAWWDLEQSMVRICITLSDRRPSKGCAICSSGSAYSVEDFQTFLIILAFSNLLLSYCSKNIHNE